METETTGIGDGTLDVLRHGFEFFGEKITCAYFKPAHGMNPDILAKYGENRLVATRHVRFIEDGDQSVEREALRGSCRLCTYTARRAFLLDNPRGHSRRAPASMTMRPGPRGKALPGGGRLRKHDDEARA